MMGNFSLPQLYTMADIKLTNCLRMFMLRIHKVLEELKRGRQHLCREWTNDILGQDTSSV